MDKKKSSWCDSCGANHTTAEWQKLHNGTPDQILGKILERKPTGIELIQVERQRQIEVEGWTPEHDAEHSHGELAMAACCYAAPQDIKIWRAVDVSCGRGEFPVMRNRLMDPWPWVEKWDKREKFDRIRRLQIAGALISAEIDRIQREADNA